jgi:lon-related putative ATP-dependent protease
MGDVDDRSAPQDRAGTLRNRLALAPEQLRRRVDSAVLPFETTADLEPLVGTIGQPRATGALEFGLEVGTVGFNVFVAGSPGSGRLSTTLDYVRRAAPERPAPDDWVYVHNFRAPDRPNAIRLPAGGGHAFASDMDEFVHAARRELARAFESEEYAHRQHEVVSAIGHRRERLVQELAQFARERSFALQVSPVGVISTPLIDGEPANEESLARLTPRQRAELEARGEEMQGRIAQFIRSARALDAEAARLVRELQREVGAFALDPLLEELRARYAESDEIGSYLADVESDILSHLDEVSGQEVEQPAFPAAPGRGPLSRYQVNALVSNGGGDGAPVVVEPNPTYYNLLGRVEYRSTFGTMVTDFREIKPGALHRANGGFLVLEAMDLFRHPFAWDALKRTLRSREIRIENLGEEYSAVPTATLRPEPIPLEVKVVLIGPPALYALLFAVDEDFRELFKVKADFAPDMEWSEEHFASYARFVGRHVREGGLRHFDRAAVARLIEHGARLRESQRKLTTRLREIADIVSEASFWAGEAGRAVAGAADVERAIAQREYRSNLLEERVRELIERGTISIETEGARVAQVNGISVLDSGDHAFGKPTRVTAQVAPGRGGVQSIEREIELSGPIHSKGVLTLAGYLAGTYGPDVPPAVSATLAFEQTYDEVEGDSASSTELYALLSALSGLPLDQGIAVTGSVDQHGHVQAVGGVTHKVEGFFAVCRAGGLTGSQGVLVPASNVDDLMLAEEVVEAAGDGAFHVWAVSTVDEGIELLTGVSAGERGPDGSFPPDTVHGRVVERLAAFAALLREPGEDEDRVS